MLYILMFTSHDCPENDQIVGIYNSWDAAKNVQKVLLKKDESWHSGEFDIKGGFQVRDKDDKIVTN